MAQVLIKNIIRQLHEIQEGSLWFDQCFKDKIDGLSASEALTNPIPQVHSVACWNAGTTVILKHHSCTPTITFTI